MFHANYITGIYLLFHANYIDNTSSNLDISYVSCKVQIYQSSHWDRFYVSCKISLNNNIFGQIGIYLKLRAYYINDLGQLEVHHAY